MWRASRDCTILSVQNKGANASTHYHIVVKGEPRGLMSEMNMYLIGPYLVRV